MNRWAILIRRLRRLLQQSLLWLCCSIRFSLAPPLTGGLAMEVMDRSPINGAFCGQLVVPGVNAWARETSTLGNTRFRQDWVLVLPNTQRAEAHLFRVNADDARPTSRGLILIVVAMFTTLDSSPAHSLTLTHSLTLN